MKAQTQEYGFTEMKKTYLKNLRRGLEYAVIFHIVVVLSFILINYLNTAKASDQKPTYVHTIINALPESPSITEDNPPEKPIEKIDKPYKQPEALMPKPVPTEQAEIQTINTQKELDKLETPASLTGDTIKYAFNGNDDSNNKKPIETPIVKPPKHIDPVDQPMTIDQVDQIPEALNLDQVKAMLIYPERAKDIGMEGNISIKVLVGKDGKVLKTGSISGPDVFYDEVKEKVMFVEFTPATKNGNPVQVWVTIPIKFRINKN